MTTFPKHDLETSNVQATEALAAVQKKYGFIPNLFSYMAEAPTTVDAYMALADLIAKTSLTAAQAQIVQLAVSVENKCEFCQVAHVATGKASGANRQTIDAILDGSEIADAKDRALVDLTLQISRKRGWLDVADLETFIAAGFTQQQVLEVILCISIKTLSNYINHLTKPVVNPELVAAAAK